MKENMNAGKIPLMIGTTGHLDIREEDRGMLRETVIRELNKLKEHCPHTPMVMLCSLARGADLLCAEAAEAAGISLWAVLPMDREEYEKDFSPENLTRFDYYMERAEKAYVAPAAEEPPETWSRDFCYRQAGIHVAEHCQVMLALWDGGPDRSGCGGTAAVKSLMDGKWQPVHGAPARCAENALTIHVMTPRKGAEGDAGEIRILGNREAMAEILAKTDEFNALAETAGDSYPLLPEDAGGDDGLRRMEEVHRAADSLSMRFAKQYRRILAGLAATGTLLTMAFLIYDEKNMIPMILLCGAMLICAFLLSGAASRSACHRRYIEYRALAETMRVQAYLRYAGSGVEAQRLMTWTQRMESAWILCAVCAMNAQPAPEKIRDIRECWVQDQQAYHRKAGRRTGRRSEGNDRTVRVILICSIAAYAVTLAFELLCGGLIFRPAIHAEDPEGFRTIMKIALGSLSAGTLFLSGYYGKLNLERRASDHAKMETFHRVMAERLAEQGQTESLLETLAREELAENGSWCSYRRDNKPELDL